MGVGGRGVEEGRIGRFFTSHPLFFPLSPPPPFDPQTSFPSLLNHAVSYRPCSASVMFDFNPFLSRRGAVFFCKTRDFCFSTLLAKKRERKRVKAFFSFLFFFVCSLEGKKKKVGFSSLIRFLQLSLPRHAAAARERSPHRRRHPPQRAQHKRLGEARSGGGGDSLRLLELLLLVSPAGDGLRRREQQRRRRRGLRRRERCLSAPSDSSSSGRSGSAPPRDHLRGSEGRRRRARGRRGRRRGRRGQRPARDRVDDGKGDSVRPCRSSLASAAAASAAAPAALLAPRDRRRASRAGLEDQLRPRPRGLDRSSSPGLVRGRASGHEPGAALGEGDAAAAAGRRGRAPRAPAEKRLRLPPAEPGLDDSSRVLEHEVDVEGGT